MTDWPRLTVLGVPWDASSSFQRGAAEGPAAIRTALWSPSTNSSTELGVAVEPAGLFDAGDLSLPDNPAAARADIESAVRAVREGGSIPIVLGGDHSITYPVLRAFRDEPPAAILHIDAHGDLYDEFPAFAPAPLQAETPEFGAGKAGSAPDGSPGRVYEVPGEVDRYSHACPFARIMEERLTGRLVQVGIRTATAHLRAQAARFGVEVYGMGRWRDLPVESLQGPLYVSLDLDGLDPAFAPGVAHPEPGGLTTRELVDMIQRIRAPLAGIDIVELNPRLDVRELTARAAAKLLKELVAIAARNHANR